jgi:hypothetical protein
LALNPMRNRTETALPRSSPSPHRSASFRYVYKANRNTVSAADSPLEGSGFEPSVSLLRKDFPGVTILRGTPPVVQQPQRPQQVQMMPPALPSCPEGYVYSLILGYCYQPQDPMYAR